MNIITIVEGDLEKGWAWVQSEAVDLYNSISGIIGSALAGFEQVVVQNLWSAAAALVSKLTGSLASGFNLADLETAFLNIIQTVGTNLLAAAQALGSNLLQSILGLLHAKLNPPVAPAS